MIRQLEVAPKASPLPQILAVVSVLIIVLLLLLVQSPFGPGKISYTAAIGNLTYAAPEPPREMVLPEEPIVDQVFHEDLTVSIPAEVVTPILSAFSSIEVPSPLVGLTNNVSAPVEVPAAPVAPYVVPSFFPKVTVDYVPGFGGGGYSQPSPAPAPVVVVPAPDTTPPAVPIVSIPASFPYTSSSTNISFSGSAESDSLIAQSLSSTTTTVVGGSWSLPLSLSEGTTTVSFTARDAALNTSSATSVVVFVDSVTPGAPVVTLPVNNHQASTTSITFIGTAESGALVYDTSSLSESYGPDWSISRVLPQGTSTVSFRARDYVGNVSGQSSLEVFVDSFAPSAPEVIVPVVGVESSSTSVLFSGTAEAGATLFNDFNSDTVMAASDGAWDLSLILPQGTTTIAFSARDLLGNVSATTSRAVFVDSIAPDAPVFLLPSPLSQTFDNGNITFSGTAEAGSVVSNSLSGSTRVADDSTWSLGASLSPGTTMISWIATDALSNVSVSTTTSITVAVAPVAPVATITECDHSLSVGSCLIATTTASISWASASGADYYEVFKDGVSLGTTTSLYQAITISDGSTSSFVVVSRSNSGLAATSSAQNIRAFLAPIVINEVAWMGSITELKDEWFELYNRTDVAITLNDTWLYSGNFNVRLSGTIAPGGYFLAERTDDSAVSDIDADQIYGDDTADYDMSDGGDQLTLVHQGTVIDRTPAVGSCAIWCGGEGDPMFSAMERRSTGAVGANSSSWQSNDGVHFNGLDVGNQDIWGTPKHENSPVVGPPPAMM